MKTPQTPEITMPAFCCLSSCPSLRWCNNNNRRTIYILWGEGHPFHLCFFPPALYMIHTFPHQEFFCAFLNLVEFLLMTPGHRYENHDGSCSAFLFALVRSSGGLSGSQFGGVGPHRTTACLEPLRLVPCATSVTRGTHMSFHFSLPDPCKVFFLPAWALLPSPSLPLSWILASCRAWVVSVSGIPGWGLCLLCWDLYLRSLPALGFL